MAFQRQAASAAEEYATLSRDLSASVAGDVRFDNYAQVLYATDGSIYQARPAGVVFPTDVADVKAAMEVATEHGVPVLPRGAGSSLAGQAVGPGCVVLDLSRHLDNIIDVDPESKRARVQPGVVQDDLDDRLAEYRLKFPPDPASSNRATIGGGIGNNSTGAHSVRYGITDAYVDEVRAVLADGSEIYAREIVLDSKEWNEIVAQNGREAQIYETVRECYENNETEIAERYPELKRRVSGYNLDRVIYEKMGGERVINLSKLLVGSEGTLGVVVEATVSLVSVPEETALALYCFDNLVAAMRAVPQALEFDVSAVELMDEEVFRLARNSEGYAEYAEPIPDDTAAALMLEFDSELHEDFTTAIEATTERFLEDGEAFDVIEAYDESTQADLWSLRKAAIPLLMSLEGDPKPYPFIEDATVPPSELAEYVQEFEAVLADHDTSAAYFAHAGSGTLHIRPILNLKQEEGVEAMHSITEDVTDLVLKHFGAFSGEHGDGMARTEFNPKMYGPELWRAFKEIKTTFDPNWQLHPGNVVYRYSADDVGPDSDRGVGADMRRHLRYGPTYQSLEPQTTLNFEEDGSFSHLVELCNGCGTCRQSGSNVMCPTYRASNEEIQATRGRANMLRAAISGELPPEELYSERFQSDVLDLCVGCKGCASDCPTGVDLAKLKAEVKHDYHERKNVSLRTRLFAHVDRASALGSALAPLSNWATAIPGSRWLVEKTVGIAGARRLPSFQRETLCDWFEDRDPRISSADANRQVLLFPDTFTNYTYPAPGKAAVRVLEAAGVHVQIPDIGPSGRAAYSVGMLDVARKHAEDAVSTLAPYIESGWDVVVVEPSDAVMFQDELRDLQLGPGANRVAENTYGICEYMDVFRLDDSVEWLASNNPQPTNTESTASEKEAPREQLTYHGHCHQKATKKDHHAVGLLRRAGFMVDPLDSGCCGMAGSFGYEAEHYDLSKAIGRILFDQIEKSSGDIVVAPGASCRTQIGDREDDTRPPHPIEKLDEALAN